MERLTARDRLGFIHIMCGKNSTKWSMKSDIVRRLADYEDTGLEPEDILSGEELAEVARLLNLLEDYRKIGGIDHLRELVQAEKDGRLVVLPCKAGTPVWWIETEIKPNGRGKWVTVKHVRPDEFCYAMLDWIDTPIYLTREEAEAALEARKGGESDA